ncbi:MAG: 50S ribosomal protein L25/general stress protein Ctc [Arenicellales bacterium]|nr:50S ribosomal protein L25/general stress protein Ctc [Arenicellales bacterium]
MSTQYQIQALPRTGRGTATGRKYRRAGSVPAVLYGAGKDNQSLLLNHNEILRNLETEGFQSAIIDIQTENGTEQAILRDVQMHPYKAQVMHVDFQRVSATEKIRIAVPLHFIGGEECPGVYNEGGIESHLINEVEVECLPADLPEYLEVDISGLHLHESVKLTDIKVPEDVVITALLHEGEDQTIASILAPKAIEEEELVEAEEEALAEGEEEEGAEPTEGEAPKEEQQPE